MLKIIAGKYRGKNIETKKSKDIRPTSGKARGAVFNILSHGIFSGEENSPIIDKVVADLFCGTGALGLEAISRGADSVIFVDQSKDSLEIARKNAMNLKEEDNCYFVRSDSTSLPKARQVCSLVFLDPPYNSGLATTALKSLDVQGWLAQDAVAVVELAHKEVFAAPPNYTAFDERKYGNSKVVFLRYVRENLPV